MDTLTVKLRHLRLAPRKVRLVADMLKGLSAEEAEAQLMLSPRRPKEALLKLLRSAIANAKNNRKLEADRLYVQSVRVDIGPRYKRWMPRAKGSAAVVQRQTSHVTLVLGVRDRVAGRFTVVRTRPKKKTEEKPKGKREKPHGNEAKPPKNAEMSEAKPKTEPGAFRRVFRRKAI